MVTIWIAIGVYLFEGLNRDFSNLLFMIFCLICAMIFSVVFINLKNIQANIISKKFLKVKRKETIFTPFVSMIPFILLNIIKLMLVVTLQ